MGKKKKKGGREVQGQLPQPPGPHSIPPEFLEPALATRAPNPEFLYLLAPQLMEHS